MPPRATGRPAARARSAARRPSAPAGPAYTAPASTGQQRSLTLSGSGSGRTANYASPQRTVSVPVPEGGDLGRSWHRVVMVEFIITIVLIGLSPVLTPRTPSSDTPEAVAAAEVAAKTLAGPLVRLTAACVLFFALALMSTGPKTGKIAAALGGLVVCGTLLNATDMFTAISQAMSPPKKKKKKGG